MKQKFTITAMTMLSFMIIAGCVTRDEIVEPCKRFQSSSKGMVLVCLDKTLAEQNKQREIAIEELLLKVNDDALANANRDEVTIAILQLGLLKATEAIPALIQKLDFHVDANGVFAIGEAPSPEDIYPAVKSLINIGKPILPYLADLFVEEKTSETIASNARHMMIVIFDREGDGVSLTKKYMNERIEKYKTIPKSLKDFMEN